MNKERVDFLERFGRKVQPGGISPADPLEGRPADVQEKCFSCKEDASLSYTIKIPGFGETTVHCCGKQSCRDKIEQLAYAEINQSMAAVI